MFKQIRIHGRGGQGAVSMAKLIALSAYYDGKKVQAFPSFGVERRGAPIESYVRISDKDISRRDHIANPDYLIILDETLLKNKGVLNGLDKGDTVLVNSGKSEEDLKKYFSIYPDIKVRAFDATSLGFAVLKKPIINTAMLGAFSFLTGLVSIKAAAESVKEVFSDKGSEVVEKNIEVAKLANDHFDPHKQFVVIPGEQHLTVIDEARMVRDS